MTTRPPRSRAERERSGGSGPGGGGGSGGSGSYGNPNYNPGAGAKNVEGGGVVRPDGRGGWVIVNPSKYADINRKYDPSYGQPAQSQAPQAQPQVEGSDSAEPYRPYPKSAYYDPYSGRQGNTVIGEVAEAQKQGRVYQNVASSAGPQPFRLLPPEGGGLIRELHARNKVEFGGGMSEELRPEAAQAIGFNRLFTRAAQKRGEGGGLADSTWTAPSGKKYVVSDSSGDIITSEISGIDEFVTSPQQPGEEVAPAATRPIIGEIRGQQSVYYGSPVGQAVVRDFYARELAKQQADEPWPGPTQQQSINPVGVWQDTWGEVAQQSMAPTWGTSLFSDSQPQFGEMGPQGWGGVEVQAGGVDPTYQEYTKDEWGKYGRRGELYTYMGMGAAAGIVGGPVGMLAGAALTVPAYFAGKLARQGMDFAYPVLEGGYDATIGRSPITKNLFKLTVPGAIMELGRFEGQRSGRSNAEIAGDFAETGAFMYSFGQYGKMLPKVYEKIYGVARPRLGGGMAATDVENVRLGSYRGGVVEKPTFGSYVQFRSMRSEAGKLQSPIKINPSGTDVKELRFVVGIKDSEGALGGRNVKGIYDLKPTPNIEVDYILTSTSRNTGRVMEVGTKRPLPLQYSSEVEVQKFPRIKETQVGGSFMEDPIIGGNIRSAVIKDLYRTPGQSIGTTSVEVNTPWGRPNPVIFGERSVPTMLKAPLNMEAGRVYTPAGKSIKGLVERTQLEYVPYGHRALSAGGRTESAKGMYYLSMDTAYVGYNTRYLTKSPILGIRPKISKIITDYGKTYNELGEVLNTRAHELRHGWQTRVGFEEAWEKVPYDVRSHQAIEYMKFNQPYNYRELAYRSFVSPKRGFAPLDSQTRYDYNPEEISARIAGAYADSRVFMVDRNHPTIKFFRDFESKLTNRVGTGMKTGAPIARTVSNTQYEVVTMQVPRATGAGTSLYGANLRQSYASPLGYVSQQAEKLHATKYKPPMVEVVGQEGRPTLLKTTSPQSTMVTHIRKDTIPLSRTFARDHGPVRVRSLPYDRTTIASSGGGQKLKQSLATVTKSDAKFAGATEATFQRSYRDLTMSKYQMMPWYASGVALETVSFGLRGQRQTIAPQMRQINRVATSTMTRATSRQSLSRQVSVGQTTRVNQRLNTPSFRQTSVYRQTTAPKQRLTQRQTLKQGTTLLPRTSTRLRQTTTQTPPPSTPPGFPIMGGLGGGNLLPRGVKRGSRSRWYKANIPGFKEILGTTTRPRKRRRRK